VALANIRARVFRTAAGAPGKVFKIRDSDRFASINGALAIELLASGRSERTEADPAPPAGLVIKLPDGKVTRHRKTDNCSPGCGVTPRLVWRGGGGGLPADHGEFARVRCFVVFTIRGVPKREGRTARTVDSNPPVDGRRILVRNHEAREGRSIGSAQSGRSPEQGTAHAIGLQGAAATTTRWCFCQPEADPRIRV